ncbi:hypothetical protein N7466_006430 [Penicillium verhagenii]|uniref:uncharacterized protein n=1 Tax=Penicillium verhagenii TaxID=1562060 RepID=UPI00254572CF|nr:uncharacterized protein N7466_006430 [Penicillium verhagenii]KAJ5930937.1 hypothetical protein N7466_006430 [Penicillium verhagenii]
MGDNSYDNSNRAFLQAFMGRSSMTFEEAQPVLAAIFSAHGGETVDPSDVTQEHLSSYISAANTAISPFDLEIRSSFRQTPKPTDQESSDSPPTRVYALVNTTSDPITQLATTYSADEIAYVKRLLDYMFDTNNNRLCEGMVITSIQALNIRSSAEANRRRSANAATQQSQGAAQSLTMTQAENMMQNLVAEGWLEKNLSPRGLMELRGWLVAEYNEEVDGVRKERIKFCAACRDIITVGQRCEDRNCLGRLHDHCMRNFFRIHRAEKCPVCKKDWPGNKFVGERAASAMNRRQPNPRAAPVPTPADPTEDGAGTVEANGEEEASGEKEASGEEEANGTAEASGEEEGDSDSEEDASDEEEG